MDGSQPLPILTPVAVQNEPLLRAIAAGPHASLSALGAAAGVVVNNLNRKLDSLADEGLIGRLPGGASHEVALTGNGEAVLAALDRASGVGPNEVRLRHDQLRADPDNARTHSGLTGEEFEGLVGSVREKGILNRIEVRAAGPDGVHVILKGERRWRAWGRLLEEGHWAPDHLETVVVVEGDDEHLTEVAIIDNVVRADLDNLEKAEAYFKLHGRFGRSPQEIAARIGTTDRHVQELLRVAEKASPDAKAAYWEAKAAGVKDAWTTLRDSVKTPKHIVELERNARLRLLIIELACRALAEEGLWDANLIISRPPPGGVLSAAVEFDLIKVEWLVGAVRAELKPLACDWLHETLAGGDDPTKLLADARQEALGPMGAMAVQDGRWGTDFLNPPPPPPPPPPAPPPPLSPAETAVDSPQTAETPASAPVTPDAGAGRAAQSGLVGDDFSRQMRAAREDADADPDAEPTPTPAPPAEPEPALIPEPKLEVTPPWRLILIEVAHKIEHHGQETRGGAIRGAPVEKFHTDAEAMKLQHAGLIGFVQNSNGAGYLAILPQAALNYLADEGFGEGVTDDQVVNVIRDTLTEGAYAAWLNSADPVDCGMRYATGWLNIAPPKKAARPEPQAKPPADPVMAGLRTAFADQHKALEAALSLLDRILGGEGAGDDEIGQVIEQLKTATVNGKPYLARDAG